MILATTVLVTAHGTFSVSLHEDESGARCLSIHKGDLGLPGTAVRPQSACLTGETLDGLDCDCKAQLIAAMREIDNLGRGVVVYLLDQEGRGAGLLHKLRGLEMQRVQGVNSYAAYEAMGSPRDLRGYAVVKTALTDLKVGTEIGVMSNHPAKLAALEQMGYAVTQLRLSYEVSELARSELLMKKEEGGYAVDFGKITFSG
ncbi:hypothetical protein AB0C84_03150 [Actinomadura sp. NPDC048955]|uniref:hypothetical protein n=1 Tax=Actinomadura sp. NPDC048955 TaxID=3158228 RepID=UPI0033C3C9F0